MLHVLLLSKECLEYIGAGLLLAQNLPHRQLPAAGGRELANFCLWLSVLQTFGFCGCTIFALCLGIRMKGV